MKRFIALFILLATPLFAQAPQGLTEAVARKSRIATVAWDKAILEDATNNYTWNPETLSFKDNITNREVWQFTTPAVLNETQDISTTHWSANGNRVMFHSLRATDAFPYATGTGKMWMLSNADGSRLKPAKSAAAQLPSMDSYIMMSPILADVAYQGAANDGQGLLYDALYKVNFSDTTISRASFLTMTGANRISVKKAISGDGYKAVVSSVNTGQFFSLTLFPEASKSVDAGYDNHLLFPDWGTPISAWAGYHDKFMSGAVGGVDGVWNYLMPENSSGTWWRARVTGTGTDSAPVYTSDTASPYNWGGELEPINSPTMNTTNPWCPQGSIAGTDCMEYFSHFTPDRWGHFGIFTKSTNSPYGTSIANLRDHKYEVTAFTPAQSAQWVQHHDWEAFSDWSASSAYPNAGSNYAGGFITAQNYKSASSQIAVTQTLTRYNATSSPPYESLARPTQSPDGTKIMFNGTYLSNTDSRVQLYWAVAYYPYPPEIKSAAKNGANVRLTWDFNQGTAGAPNLTTPRTYATRGWPHETESRPPSPREIKHFRVWVSANGTTWSPVGTTNYLNCSGTNECGTWTEESWTFDYAQSNNTTRYYAVTSVEHSGLESHALSNVWKVTLDSGGTATISVQEVAYPVSPGGESAFYTTAPGAPSDVAATHQASGRYAVSWTAPVDSTLVRHFNIYAKDGSTPTASQGTRIASVAKTVDYDANGVYSFLDLLGNPDGSTQYLVTAVDFQGNESTGDAPEPPADPIISITSPTSAETYTTTAESVTIGGSSSDDGSISSVAWVNAAGGSGTATGTTTWSISISLELGENVITITVTDNFGATATDMITITRNSPSSGTKYLIFRKPN